MAVKRTLGIDLSADSKKTAACLIAWDGRRADIEELLWGGYKETPLLDDDLLELISRANKTGVDAPFGWPVEFVKAVRSWQRGRPWPASENLIDYRYRLTDKQIKEPRPPLSVSSDLVAVTAMRP